jgi:hypothetical protein
MGLSQLQPEDLRDRDAARQAEFARALRAESGHLSTAVEGHFRRFDDGTLCFYPQGPFGLRGYVVETEDLEAALRRRARRVCRWSYGLMFVVLFAFNLQASASDIGLIWLIPAVAAAWILEWVLSNLAFLTLTRGMARARRPNNPLLYWRRMGRTMRPALLILCALVFFLIPASSLVVFALRGEPVGLVIGSLFFLVVASPYSVALYGWLRDRRGGVADARGRPG